MSDDEAEVEAGPQVVVLFTSVTSDKMVRANQERLEQLFYVRGVPIKQIDASDAENKTLREELFKISGKKGVYPQVFIEQVDGKYTFIGDYKAIHAMNEANDITGAFDRRFVQIAAYANTLSESHLRWLDKKNAEIAAQAPWDQCVTKSGDTYWFCRTTGESSWVDPVGGVGPGGVWIPQNDSKGRRFFYNRRTGQSAWKVPES